MAFPLLPFAVGIAVGALAATRLRGTRTGVAIHRRACRLYGEAADRLSVALSREGRLVREYFPQAPADPTADDDHAPPEGSRQPGVEPGAVATTPDPAAKIVHRDPSGNS